MTGPKLSPRMAVELRELGYPVADEQIDPIVADYPLAQVPGVAFSPASDVPVQDDPCPVCGWGDCRHHRVPS